MFAIFEQVLILFVFIAAGYVLGKTGVVNKGHTQILSTLLVYVFSTSNTFSTFSKRFNVQYISENYPMLIASVAVLAVIALMANFLGKRFSKDNYEQGVYEYALAMPNSGYFGYAFAAGVLGQAGLLDLMVFCIPMNIYTGTYSFCRLTGKPINIRKIFTPPFIAILIGAAVGLSGIKLPSVAVSIVDSASACMAPVSMLLGGIVISEFRVKDLLKDKRTYILTAMRLIAIPTAIGALMRIIGAAAGLNNNAVYAAIVTTTVIYLDCPCGLNTIIYPKLVGKNCNIGAGLVLVSNVCACLTLPIVLNLFGIGV